MTEELKKEAISIKYLEVIANYNGYSTSWPGKDYGVDLTVSEIGIRTENDKNRHYDTGRELKIQAKSTLYTGYLDFINSETFTDKKNLDENNAELFKSKIIEEYLDEGNCSFPF